jgi:hypothetical protein
MLLRSGRCRRRRARDPSVRFRGIEHNVVMLVNPAICFFLQHIDIVHCLIRLNGLFHTIVDDPRPTDLRLVVVVVIGGVAVIARSRFNCVCDRDRSRDCRRRHNLRWE